jgi:Tol biopolymer transport system component
VSTTARPSCAAEQKRLKRDIASSQAASAPAAQPASPPLAARSWRGWFSLLVAALALFAGLAVGFFLGWREASPPPLTYHKLTFQRGTIFAARFSPDGQTIFYSAEWNGNPVEVFSVLPAFPDSRPLGIPKTNLAAISSSGQIAITLRAQSTQEVGFSGILAQMPSAAGAPREIAENVEWADWAPDGKSLAVVRSAAGRHRLEFPVGKVLYETTGWISHSRISPKGDLIAFLDHPAIPDDRGSVMVVDFNGKTRTLSQEYQSVGGLAWSPQGDEIWFTASTEGFARALRTANLAARERLVLKVPGGLKLEDISRDGRFLLTHESTQFGISGLAPGDRKERDLSWLDQSLPADLSSDGGTLLFTEQGEYASPLYASCLRKMDGSSPVRLGDGQALALSPSGRWALSLLLTSPQRLTLLSTEGGNSKLIDRDGIDHYEPQAAWFPDGRRILINADESGHGARCYVQDIEGGKPEPVTPEGTFNCLLSSDGKVVLATHADGTGSLYTLSSGESRTIAGLASGDTPIHFSEDGRSIYTYRSAEVPATISRLDLATGRKTVWKQPVPPVPAGLVSIPRIVVTRDGKSYAYSYSRILSDLYLIQGLK